MRIKLNLLEKVKGFLLEPSKTFDATKEEKLGEATKYYAVIAGTYSAIYSAIFAALQVQFVFILLTTAFMYFNTISALMQYIDKLFGSMMTERLDMLTSTWTSTNAGGAPIIFFVWLMILSIIMAFIGGAVVHIFVYLVGGRKGIKQTIKAMIYGLTPGLLLGWIPIVSYFAAIWSLVLGILGVRQLHELTTGRAVLAVSIPFMITVILVIGKPFLLY
jgi:hypothetical protein